MEVVSTSILVPSEIEKTSTACGYQTMNFFCISRDLMRGLDRKPCKREIIDS